MTDSLVTQNEKTGFWGAAKNCLGSKQKVKKAWNTAFNLISETANFTPQETLALLDSQWGRQIVDEFYDELQDNIFFKEFSRRITAHRLYCDYTY